MYEQNRDSIMVSMSIDGMVVLNMPLFLLIDRAVFNCAGLKIAKGRTVQLRASNATLTAQEVIEITDADTDSES